MQTARCGDVLGFRFDPHDRDGWRNSQDAPRRVHVQSEAAAMEATAAALFGGVHHARERDDTAEYLLPDRGGGVEP